MQKPLLAIWVRSRLCEAAAFTLLLSAPMAFGAATMTADGSLPQVLADGKFYVAVTIAGITADQVKLGATDPTDPDQQLAARIVVTLPDVAATALPTEGIGATASAPLTVTWYRDHKETLEADGTSTYVYFVAVDEGTKGALAAYAKNDQLKVSIHFNLGGTASANAVGGLDDLVFFQPTLESGKAVPPGVIPLAGGAQILWTPSANDPAMVTAYAVNKTLGGAKLKLPAKHVSGIVGVADQAAECTWYGDATTDTCVICPSYGDYYLDADAIAKVPGVVTQTAATVSGGVVLPGLTSGTTYVTFLQFAAKGIGISQCMPAFPY